MTERLEQISTKQIAKIALFLKYYLVMDEKPDVENAHILRNFFEPNTVASSWISILDEREQLEDLVRTLKMSNRELAALI